MIRRLFLAQSGDTDPYRNLALEQHLLETCPEDACILYLWQNQNTVVIGRNQNPWKECRITRMQEDGAALARRLSGGGAVFHDLGNLNFTFLLSTDHYDLRRQSEVVLRAVRSLGIDAQRTGRNDITAEGGKFSGNAFFHNRGRSYHHGTLLVDTDIGKMSAYLQPGEAKLKARGVDSVRSRVVDLKALRPSVTIGSLRDAMIAAFREVYALPAAPYDAVDEKTVEKLREKYADWDWNYGRELPCDLACEDRFPWGGVQLGLRIDGGVVRHVSVWTDAMRWDLSEKLQAALKGCRFETKAMCEAVTALDLEEGADICALLRKQDL